MTILMPVSVVYIIVFSGYQIFTIIYSAKSEIMDRQFFCGARTVIKPQDLFLSTEGPRIQLHTPVCWHQLWDTSHPTASMSRMLRDTCAYIFVELLCYFLRIGSQKWDYWIKEEAFSKVLGTYWEIVLQRVCICLCFQQQCAKLLISLYIIIIKCHHSAFYSLPSG